MRSCTRLGYTANTSRRNSRSVSDSCAHQELLLSLRQHTLCTKLVLGTVVQAVIERRKSNVVHFGGLSLAVATLPYGDHGGVEVGIVLL